MKQQRIKASDIHVPANRHRKTINTATVNAIAASIKEIGLRNPISVHFVNDIEIDGEICDNVAVLVAGAHRREALMLLGEDYEWVDCDVFDDQRTARKWEISENLHRAELKKLERDEHIAEWIALTEERQEEVRLSQPVMATLSDGRKAPPQNQESGVNAAARELGVNRMDAHRAVSVASLPEEAKQAARDNGLDDNRSALLSAAKEMKDHGPDAAIAKIKEIAAARASKKAEPKTVSVDRAIGIMNADLSSRAINDQRADQELNDQAQEVIEFLGKEKMPYLLALLEGNPRNLAAAIRRAM